MTEGPVVTDAECIEFLQWALPRLRLRWPGFRKVRGQVRKRLRRRLRALGIDGLDAYRDRLEARPEEWRALDAMCRISISRFCRDKRVFRFLETVVLPAVAERAVARGAGALGIWSAGCGSGEEPYSLAIIWNLALSRRFPGLGCRILATDSSPQMIARATDAQYGAGTLKDLPNAWRDGGFQVEDGLSRLRESHRSIVDLRLEDIRESMPDGPFDMLLCRNLAFTYFDQPLQTEILRGLLRRLHAGGALVIGSHERLPVPSSELTAWSEKNRIYRRTGDA